MDLEERRNRADLLEVFKMKSGLARNLEYPWRPSLISMWIVVNGATLSRLPNKEVN